MEQYSGVLKTPCGNILVVDEDNAYIPFHIEKNKFDCDYEFENADGKTKVINTDTNYAIVIKTSSLKYGTCYRIYMPETKLEFCDSDEHTECVSGCSNGYCIAIGAYSPNDDKKQEQAYAYSEKMGFLKHRFIQDPPTFDESKFTDYDRENLLFSGIKISRTRISVAIPVRLILPYYIVIAVCLAVVPSSTFQAA